MGQTVCVSFGTIRGDWRVKGRVQFEFELADEVLAPPKLKSLNRFFGTSVHGASAAQRQSLHHTQP